MDLHGFYLGLQIFTSPATRRYSHRVNINEQRLFRFFLCFFFLKRIYIVETSINSNLCRRISFVNAIKLIKHRFYGKLRRRTMANDLQLSIWASRVLGEDFFEFVVIIWFVCLLIFHVCAFLNHIHIYNSSTEPEYYIFSISKAYSVNERNIREFVTAHRRRHIRISRAVECQIK